MSPLPTNVAAPRTASARWLARLVALAAALVLSVTIAPAPAAQAIGASTLEQEVRTQANRERSKRDLARVEHSACLDRFAEAQARAMAKKRSMFHQPLKPVLDGCKLSLVGENVAYGFSSGTSVTKAWMNSPGHRANLLNPKFRSIGVGAYKDSKGTWYIAQVLGRSR
ncbi:CAP domain-containing protein [Auraticoccus monumenti]|uniref:Uncharacterized conserved protein YkwD, contains CAP (CSP/antigen 5/PR1) domain n=1 Tax=Auraticoccus monumenti TaxID=675864 RepID=A0A1G7DXT3_9ACTN|nr:CAP domain-containing protein [Auraticoccus monumenti]SDE56307.1 Uncharacterized conserved protein YkwD, contains CAP (CSP/antigen 5/PR1) domain [Auraticoccus monumenti]